MFRFLLTWLYSTLLPEPRAAELTCVWQRSPGISPLRGSLRAAPIACVCGWTESSGLAESLQDSLPKLLLDGWVPLVTLLGRLYARATLPHRWSSRILRIAVPFLAHPLDVIQSLDMYFSSCTRWTENVPSMHRPRERLFYKVV